MSLVRLYVCQECGAKYWPDPDHKWDMVCPSDDAICRMVTENEVLYER